jgi:hypothetical protein
VNFVSKQTEMAMSVVVAKAALLGLYEHYASGGGFSMDKYHNVEQHLENLLARLQNRAARRIIPNPCGEILLPSGAEILRRHTRPDND